MASTGIAALNPIQSSLYPAPPQHSQQMMAAKMSAMRAEARSYEDEPQRAITSAIVNGQGWIDAVDIHEDTLKEYLKTNRPLRFDWENKWLRGDQYAHMLNNIDAYCKSFSGMAKLGEKQHPENIYLEPLSKCNQIYKQYNLAELPKFLELKFMRLVGLEKFSFNLALFNDT